MALLSQAEAEVGAGRAGSALNGELRRAECGILIILGQPDIGKKALGQRVMRVGCRDALEQALRFIRIAIQKLGEGSLRGRKARAGRVNAPQGVEKRLGVPRFVISHRHAYCHALIRRLNPTQDLDSLPGTPVFQIEPAQVGKRRRILRRNGEYRTQRLLGLSALT